jgi:hypothetical protein
LDDAAGLGVAPWITPILPYSQKKAITQRCRLELYLKRSCRRRKPMTGKAHPPADTLRRPEPLAGNGSRIAGISKDSVVAGSGIGDFHA